MQLRDSIMFIIIIILQPTVKVSCPVTLSSMVELLATPSSQLGLVKIISDFVWVQDSMSTSNMLEDIKMPLIGKIILMAPT